MGVKGFSLRPPPYPARPLSCQRGPLEGGKLSICWGCHSEVPQTGWLQRSTALGVRGPRLKCQQGSPRESLPQSLMAADSLWVPWLVNTSPQSLPSASRGMLPVCVLVSECPLPVGTLVTLGQGPP